MQKHIWAVFFNLTILDIDAIYSFSSKINLFLFIFHVEQFPATIFKNIAKVDVMTSTFRCLVNAFL